jgi:tRNA A-37 threonylcarbamoyl transferase component Bud32
MTSLVTDVRDGYCISMPDEPQTSIDSALTAAMPPGIDAADDAPTTSPSTAAPMVVAEPDERIGEFKLLRKLGQGGMAAVWLAEQTSLHRNVALKLLRPDLMADPTYVKRFQTEAKAAAGLNHPNIVQVYVIGEDAGKHFIAQEYVQGSTLKAHLQKRGPLDLNLALHVMRQVAGALQTAGERGIVHRDIKPENIMLTKKGEAKVADFGLAQLTLGGEKLNLTQEGVTMGTPLYMSPEQVNGKKLDARSDIYSFGVTCYHMLAGRPPFQGETAIAVAVQHLQNEPKPLKELRPDLPQPVCDLVHRMMAKQPEQRYPDAATVLEDVRKLIRVLKESGRLEQVKLADIGEDAEAQRTFTGRHPVLSLTLLCLLAAGASAGVGWWMRPGNPLLAQADSDAPQPQPKLSSAKEQFLNAMLRVNDEEAFRAVIQHWDLDPASGVWVARAHEQLALLFLRSPDRRSEAQTQLEAMRSMTGAFAEEFEAKSRVGDAVLAAYNRRPEDAQRILGQHRSLLEKYQLYPDGSPNPGEGGAWRRLIEDIRARMQQPPRRPEDRGPANATV